MVVELSRTVRFCLNDEPAPSQQRNPAGVTPTTWPPRHNGFSAWPPMRGLGRYYQLVVRCRGQADPVTGYFISIKQIDKAVAEAVLPDLQRLIHTTGSAAAVPMGRLMQRIMQLLQKPLDGSVIETRLDLTPYYALTIRSRAMDHVIICQQYEFAAAHRLHSDRLSDEENRRVFGKCNNPSGHGHNYRLEVAVQAPVDPGGGLIPVEAIDALVDETVIQKLDHKHLNADVPQFKNRNPSVEHIAQVIYSMVEQPLRSLGVELEAVSVWETDKTVCTYRRQSQLSEP